MVRRCGRRFGVHYAVDADGVTCAAVGASMPDLGVQEISFSLRKVHTGFQVAVDGVERKWTYPDLAWARLRLQSLIDLYAAEHTTQFSVVHAGVVAFQRKAIVLPGRSTVGKSTLTSALVRAGGTYMSDEYALIDECGVVHSFPRPIRLRDADGRPVEGSPGFQRIGPLPIKLVAHLRFDEMVGWDVRPTSTGEQVLCLMDNAVNARRRGRMVLEALSQAALAAAGYIGTRGEADESAQRLLSLLHRA